MARRSDRASDAPLFAWGDALRLARARRRQLIRRAADLAIGCALIGATIVAPPAPRLVWNASESAPVGLYAVNPGVVADRSAITFSGAGRPLVRGTPGCAGATDDLEIDRQCESGISGNRAR